MSTRKLTATIGVTIMAAAGLSACGGGDEGGGGSSTSPVSIGISEPQHLVPSNTVESNGTQVVVSLWTPLVTFDEKGTPVMAAAASIDSSDQKVWTVKLKPDWKFHNGEPVTSDNYIQTWNFAAYGPHTQLGANFYDRIQGYDDLQAPEGGGTPKSTQLSGLKKVDDTTIQITLKAPFSEFGKVLGYNVFYPMPKVAFGPDGNVVKGFEDAPVGQGPFQMDGKWNHNQSIKVKEYTDYQGTKPKVGAIDFKMYQDQETMYNDLISGNLDVQPQIPPSRLGQAPSELGDRFKKTPSSYIGFITVPNYIPAYSHDIRVALSKAFDRKQITEKIFQGAYTPATSWVSPIIQGYRPDTCGDACVYDPTKAKQLWQQAGGVPGNKITLYYNSDGAHKEWVDAVCNQWKTNLGVNCQGGPVAQFADLRDQAREHKLQGLLRGAWSFDYPSIEDYLTPLYYTKAPSNDGGYSNKTFDQTIRQGDSAPTPEAAIAKYQAAEDIVAKDMPVIPTWFRQNLFGYSARMANVNVDLFANVDVVTLETT